MSAELEDLLTIDEAATLLRTSKKVLRRRIDDGEFDVVRDGRVVLVPRDSLVAHLRDHLVRSLRAEIAGGDGRSANRRTPAEERLTPEDVAGRCRLGRKAVSRAIERGELRATKICSRLRVLPQDVDAWIEQGRIEREPT